MREVKRRGEEVKPESEPTTKENKKNTLMKSNKNIEISREVLQWTVQFSNFHFSVFFSSLFFFFCPFLPRPVYWRQYLLYTYI